MAVTADSAQDPNRPIPDNECPVWLRSQKTCPLPCACQLQTAAMIKLCSLLLPALLVTTSCFANIGETEGQVNDRYGKSFGQIPTKTFGVVTGYIAGGYVVGVKFVDGTSEMEMFAKADHADLPASEISRLMNKNSLGEWKAELTGKPQWRRWRRDDGSAVALYDAVRHFLYINSKNFYEVKGQQIEQQEWKADQAPQAGGAQPRATASPAGTPSPSPSP